ncbi:MAG: TolC family protein [Myxococcales bacterium]|nr:TolC family protein [Myxococcales bacterium]
MRTRSASLLSSALLASSFALALCVDGGSQGPAFRRAHADTTAARSPADASSSAAGGPLLLPEVVQSVERFYPLIEAAQRDVQIAEAELQTARGAFDPIARARADGAALGYYQGGRADLLVEAPTPWWGTTFFGGYRVSFGKFADYDGKLETNQYGELRAGVQVPMWRNGPIDRRRANISRAELGRGVATTGLVQQRIDSLRLGGLRYWDWLAAGQRFRTAQALLQLATTRDDQMAIRVQRGELPAIERTDNRRALLQRKGLTVLAERALQQAAIELSLYLRASDGMPVLVDMQRMPSEFPRPPSSGIDQSQGRIERDIEWAMQRRPDVERLRLQREQQRVERDWARNQMAPGIDAQVAVSQDFGPGLASREPTVLEGSLVIDIPTLNRAARGRSAAAQAAMQRIDAQLRLQRDRVGTELRDMLSALAAAAERVRIATDELKTSREVEAAERERFALGDSTLFVVNLREQATFEAALREIDALADFQRALTTYRAVLVKPDAEP